MIESRDKAVTVDMTEESEVPADEVGPPNPHGMKPRIVALAALTTLAIGAVSVARMVYFAMTDAWMAPTTLSPDSDAVLAINVKLNEQEVERAKLRSDIERIDVDVRGIESAAAELRALENNLRDSLRWTTFTTTTQNVSSNDRLRALDAQRRLLDTMIARQEELVATAQRHVEAGLSVKATLDHEEQVLDQLRLNRLQNSRESLESQAQSAQLSAAATALRDPSHTPTSTGVLPEIVSGQERSARLRLDLIKLESEKRALLSQRAIAAESLSRMEDVLRQLRSRPAYRAVQAQTDVAFVPYTQLEAVKPGAPLYSCKWVLFRCAVVGRVAEVLPGEVVAHDPWNNLARGQYAILELSEREAAREKVLRARAKP
ncbi:MAG: hypothetical protein JST00_04165 [Deltaproteobacteria bacterium]|nr:hypothetical protein [Deltaproteobacteria bacterium]